MDTMGKLRRTHYCGETVGVACGSEIVAAGFVAKTRNLGNLIFCDLRDCTGILQLAFDETTDPAVFEKAKSLRGEYVVMAKGTLRERASKNPDLPTGDFELFVSELLILSQAQTPPFEIRDDVNVRDDLALTYRYLDLRRPVLQNTIQLRHRIVKCARDYFDENHFTEIETPIMIRSTPEGARDYLVPSRVQQGRFYALPQSPQLYKQLLMIAGFDRYMQIARCFRDEDLRADRQPEFTQIDLEMSFADIDDIIAVNEGFVKRCFKQTLGVDVTTPFPRLTYAEAMDRFGSDKPDTRFGLELQDISDVVKGCDFKVFADACAAGGSVRAINAKGMADKLTRKEIDRLAEYVKTYRAKGLAWCKLGADGASGSYEKFLSDDEKNAVRAALGAEPGDVLFIVADRNKVVFDALGALRCEIARQHGLIPKDTYNLLWITEFPLFEYSEEEERFVAMHHPFTAPMDGDLERIVSDPGACRAKAYDIVLNGVELGGGSIRISNPATQRRMFEALGFTEERMQKQFGFLIDAYRYGAPPHGGMAYGLDRFVMLLLQRDTIRDVIAFPKVQNAGELMSGCPDTVDRQQLDELGIKLIEKE